MSEDAAPPPRLPAPIAHAATADAEFARLLEIMRLLRSPAGCPWDREQTWQTLAPYVLEEAYEVVDAIDRDAADDLRGEVGDLVFEGVFLAQVAADHRAFTMADALREVNEKLIRRHPHVFAGPESTGDDARAITTAGAVLAQWDEIKAAERRAAGTPRDSVLDGLPTALPALTRAHALGARAATSGFDWPDVSAVLDKIEEEIGELRAELANGRADRLAEELGDLLFGLAQLGRKAGVDPEAVLRAASAKFTARFRALEQEIASQGRRMNDVPLEDLEEVWQRVKRAQPPGYRRGQT